MAKCVYVTIVLVAIGLGFFILLNKTGLIMEICKESSQEIRQEEKPLLYRWGDAMGITRAENETAEMFRKRLIQRSISDQLDDEVKQKIKDISAKY